MLSITRAFAALDIDEGLDWLQSLKQFFINVSYHIPVASLTLMALFFKTENEGLGPILFLYPCLSVCHSNHNTFVSASYLLNLLNNFH